MELSPPYIAELLWAILGLQIIFVVTNLACKFLGCGEVREPDYNRMLSRGTYGQVIKYTEERLEAYPFDKNALYFRAKALLRLRRINEAKECIKSLAKTDVFLAQSSYEWLKVIDTLEWANEKDPTRWAEILDDFQKEDREAHGS